MVVSPNVSSLWDVSGFVRLFYILSKNMIFRIFGTPIISRFSWIYRTFSVKIYFSSKSRISAQNRIRPWVMLVGSFLRGFWLVDVSRSISYYTMILTRDFWLAQREATLIVEIEVRKKSSNSLTLCRHHSISIFTCYVGTPSWKQQNERTDLVRGY